MMKMKLENAKINDAFVIEKKKIKLTIFMENSRIVLHDTSLLDDESVKCIIHMKNKINKLGLDDN